MGEFATHSLLAVFNLVYCAAAATDLHRKSGLGHSKGRADYPNRMYKLRPFWHYTLVCVKDREVKCKVLHTVVCIVQEYAP